MTQHSQVSWRKDAFVDRTETKIWQEQPNPENPYVAASCRCHGYDLLQLMAQCRFVEVLYLLFRGELPATAEAEILECLMIALINPGPRHPAARAAMVAGVGKSMPEHILPIALTILGGNHLGAGSIEATMRFLRQHQKQDPTDCAMQYLAKTPLQREQDWILVPGFGCRFGSVDSITQELATHLVNLPGSGPSLQWGQAFAKTLQPHHLGWLTTGIAAAVFTDLGFNPKAGAGLFQLLQAPGLLAHGVELANKPFTAMPFVKDENYVIKD